MHAMMEMEMLTVGSLVAKDKGTRPSTYDDNDDDEAQHEEDTNAITGDTCPRRLVDEDDDVDFSLPARPTTNSPLHHATIHHQKKQSQYG